MPIELNLGKKFCWSSRQYLPRDSRTFGPSVFAADHYLTTCLSCSDVLQGQAKDRLKAVGVLGL